MLISVREKSLVHLKLLLRYIVRKHNAPARRFQTHSYQTNSRKIFAESKLRERIHFMFWSQFMHVNKCRENYLPKLDQPIIQKIAKTFLAYKYSTGQITN